MDLVMVKVGLRKFQSTREILSKSGYFSERMELEPSLTLIDVDRDPQFFGPLLAYLRKGKLSLDPTEMSAAEKYQLFADILFYKLDDLTYLITEDVEREKNITLEDIVRMNKEKEQHLEALKAQKEKETDVAKLTVIASGGDPNAITAGDPGMPTNGQGCFLCGTIDHDESTCKFSQNTAAG